MPGSEPKVLTYESGAQFTVGDSGDLWFPPFPLVNSYPEQLDVIKGLKMREDDVILAGYPKSGSHWFFEIISMLLAGKAEYKRHGKAADMLDSNSPDQIEAIASPRVLNTHVLFRHMPREAIEKKAKIVVLLRNPKDVCVSLYHHTKDWVHGGYTGTWNSFFDIYLDTGLWYGTWFDTVLDWEREMKNNPDVPILIASYEDMLKNPLEEIIKLSQFLGLERSRDLCTEIVERCSFQHLKKASDTLKDPEFPPGTWRENATGFFRKGKAGDWKNWFSVAQNERFDEIYNARMKDSKTKVTFELS